MDAANLSGYQITEQLYAGTRTIVYRAIRTSNKYPVVIKLLRNEYPKFNEIVGFRNQYTIAKNLDFPSIIKPLSLEAYGNSYALVMEDFGGISLSTYLKTETDKNQSSNSLSLTEFLNLALQLTDILNYLYQNRVIHKDIKPANILINPETKQVKLIDFSISSLLPRETQEIQNANALEGTLAYLSPEQTGRMNRGIDYRSDFYSLGITYYELLTGKLPFVSEDAMQLVHCHLAKQSTPIHQVNPKIPLVLSQIVSKLMAKNAENRYQSALGLKQDLENCLAQLQATGKIAYFELGKRDITDRFLIPEKLYGRESEVETLLQAFERVSLGATEMMLVAGFSGIGKTAVVNEVDKPIVRQHGYFIKGKYDQFKRNIPFSAFVQAFRDLMGQLLSESDRQLNAWKSKILEVVGDNGQVLIDVIPELERIIGTQQRATELSGTAAQNRFNLLMQKFVQVFTCAEHPLVMFLDDLQWADYASLKLLQLLMSDTEYLLILGAYRDNEVSTAHPFILTVDEIVKTGASVNTITLQPLSLVDLNQLVVDTLNCEFLLAQPLTELVYQKTQGNPFFATQFLKALHDDHLINFNWDICHWQCDIAQVRALAITSDVVEFMALQLQKLPIATQEVLKLAACIGAQFDLNTLAIVSEKSLETTADDLWKALQEGLIIPNTEIYKFFLQSDSASVSDAAANPTYRFLHDRVQQATYSLICEHQRQVTHYRIGQLLLQKLSGSEQNERLFDIVNQLNYGQHFLDRKMDGTKLAKLNLAAGKKAKLSTAYAAAIDYLNIGIYWLGEGAWKNQYDVTFDLYSNLAESQLNNSSFQEVEATIAFALQWIISPVDRVKIYILQVIKYTLQAKYQEAIQVGLVGLESLGIVIEKGEISELVGKEFAAIENKLEHRSITSLLDLPTVIEPAIEAAITLLISIDPTTYIIGDLELYSFVSLRATYLSIEHGNVPGSIKAYANYGLLLGTIQKRYQRGYEFANLALQLSYKLNSRSMQSKACMSFGGWIQVWAKPIAGAADINYEGFLAGVDSGENQFAGYNLFTNIFNRLFQGEHLATVAEDIKKYWLVAQKDQNELLLLALAGANIFIMNLCQEPEGKLAEALMTEEELVDRAQTSQSLFSQCLYYILKMHLCCLTGNFDQALYYTTEAGKILSSIAGFTTSSSYSYYSSLILLKLCPTLSDSQQRDALQQVQSNQERLKTWSDSCPENFLHKYFLVEAEQSRLLENKAAAINYYDRAICLAKENSYQQEEALANELAAKFYLDWGKEKVAQAYMIESYYCYTRWGAKAKVVDLETRYPQLLQPILQSPKTSLDPLETLSNLTHSSTQGCTSNISETLDFGSVIKAAQALSSTIKLDELLKQLTQIILQNSGGDQCILVLPQDETWQVKAISTLENTELCSEPLKNYPNVPIKLIQYVKRTRSVVVINNLQTDLPVIDDYLNQHQPKSILCLPILNQGHLAGILYLKNQSTAGVFTSSHITVINFLCTQAAISLENARLYQQSQAYAQQLQQSQLRIIQSEKMSALGNLVAGVAHEINNPVGFISGNLHETQQTVQDLVEHLNLYRDRASETEIADHAVDIDLDYIIEDLPKMIDSMKLGCDRIKGISTSLRTFSRADTDRPIACNIHDGMDSTIMILKHRLKANENRPEIAVVKEYGNLPQVECYAGQLNQVFMNLLANAIDALDESNQGMSYEDITNEITIKTKLSMDHKQVTIRIKDNGIGMIERVREKIFGELFTTKAVGKGTGLGLAIARQIIVEKHGGAIDVNSIQGEGTEFVIALPVCSLN